MVGRQSDRLDGWKAIAGHFGRERTTVIRWARDRGMPVHALPGGKTRTVYALVGELETWARSNDTVSAPVDEPASETEDTPAAPPEADAQTKVRRLVPIGAVGILAASIVGISLLASHHAPSRGVAPPSHQALPSDPTAAALLVQARDDWATRSAESLARSVKEFQRVTLIEPRFAPAFADLADSYLLAGEAGSLPSSVVYDSAEHAAVFGRVR